MKKLDLQKEENARLYLFLDFDTDGSLYYRDLFDVEDSCPNFITNLLFNWYYKWIDNLILERKLAWYFVIGYKLYFTYDNRKYKLFLPSKSVGVEEFYVRQLVNKLRKLKCSKFYFKEGRVD